MKGKCPGCEHVHELMLTNGWSDNPTHNLDGYEIADHDMLNTSFECDGSGMTPADLVWEDGDIDPYEEEYLKDIEAIDAYLLDRAEERNGVGVHDAGESCYDDYDTWDWC